MTKEEYHTIGEDGVSKAKTRIPIERVYYEVSADGEVLEKFDDANTALDCAYYPDKYDFSVVGKCSVDKITIYAPRRERLF